MKYKITVKSKNQMFLINGRNVRSPFISIIDETALKSIKAKLKYYSLQEIKDYEIFEIIENDYSKINLKPKINNTVIIEPVKEVKLIKEEIKTIKIPNVVVQNIKSNTDFNIKREQIINKDTNDTEVKIEELSEKSMTILEKILSGEFLI